MDDRDLIARAVIVRSGSLLVNANTNNKTGEKYLALPGGHVDPGEDCLTALRREIVEELTASVYIGDLLFVSESIYPGRYVGETKRHELTLFFTATLEGETAQGDEVSSPESDKKFHWIAMDELEGANLLPVGIKQRLLHPDGGRYAFCDTSGGT